MPHLEAIMAIASSGMGMVTYRLCLRLIDKHNMCRSSPPNGVIVFADTPTHEGSAALKLATQNLKRLNSHVQDLQTRAEATEICLVTEQDEHLLSELIKALEEIQKSGTCAT